MAQNNIPVSEIYWSLVDKADKKFSRVRDLPYYGRNRYDTYFQKVFKVYTQLWKFQQENRQKLVEAGLKRWEIGEIASRIAQLYYGQYLRTSEASYLSESYIFYDAILSREYFKEGLSQDLNLVNKQLRFLARFLIACLVLNRREMVHQLVNQLKMLVDEYKRTLQVIFSLILYFHSFQIDELSCFGQNTENDCKEWKQVVQEIVRFLKVDTAFMNIRPLRYSLALDSHPDSLTHVASFDGKRGLRLRDAILSSYHHNEVKFAELTLDTFRMLQCLEWEPSGSFYQTSADSTSGSGANVGQNGAAGLNRFNYSQDIIDPTLPPNPRKAILYRPFVTNFIAVLATICEELPPDGVLLIYLSASGNSWQSIPLPSSSETCMNTTENIVGNCQYHDMASDAHCTSPLNSPHDNQTPPSSHSEGNHKSNHTGCLHMGTRGNGGLNCIYPSDLLPFTRRPLFLIIDSDSSQAFKAGLEYKGLGGTGDIDRDGRMAAGGCYSDGKWLIANNHIKGTDGGRFVQAINGSEKGEPTAMLLSPSSPSPTAAVGSSRHATGSQFTMFLTAPLQAFCLLLGFSGSSIEMDVYNKADKLLSSSLNDWGLKLATSDTLNSVWAQVLCDPFLRRILLRFIFCRAVVTLYAPTFNKKEFLPECMPPLPESVLPMTATAQTIVLQIANIFCATNHFIFSDGIMLPANWHDEEPPMTRVLDIQKANLEEEYED
ncbi:hypothetical protein HHK36_000773 [Tetracentron sinense]|uniref:Protein SCAI n=1 Tax=Tetracentron sinense TaxID=13715 RepID=A0A835DRE4_TETSI|nr:hypothetical protein HHK36_000773 [Tetracentron sinense]